MKYLIPAICLAAAVLAGGASARQQSDRAIFAGGCFWCMEAAYQELEGVHSVVSGFTGGELPNPTYDGDHRGHWEAVEIVYDPALISYERLLHRYWRNIDPFDGGGQFCDRGHSYKSAIFAIDEAQRQAAQSSLERARQALAGRGHERRFATEVLDAGRFWPVKEYHQDYYKKNPWRYKYYVTGCRRYNRLRQLWGDEAGG